MVTREDIQSFLDRVEGGTVEATEMEPGLWRAKTQTGAEVVVNYAPPVVILRVRVMEPPAERREAQRALPPAAGVQCPRSGARLLRARGRARGAHRRARAGRPGLHGVRGELGFPDARARLPSERARAVPGKVELMGIFDRFSTMLRSNINDLISRAENPEKMLNQLILDMKSNLAKAKQEAAAAIADEKKLQADAEALKKQAEDWERRAMLAVQEGRDDLATQALMRYNEALQGAQQLHETWVKHKADTESLKGQLRQLNDKIEEAKRKKNILVARAKRAEAQQRIQETMSGHERQERLRVVRPDGREDRGHRAEGARRRRDPAGVPVRRPDGPVQEAGVQGHRRPAAPGPQGQDGHAGGGSRETKALGAGGRRASRCTTPSCSRTDETKP